MRQAGVLAAAAMVALTEMVDRLAEDHANAQLLAQGLSRLDGVLIDPAEIETNLVFFQLTQPNIEPLQFVGALQERGILIGGIGGRRLRAVTNHHVSAHDIETALDGFEEALRAGTGASRVRSVYA